MLRKFEKNYLKIEKFKKKNLNNIAKNIRKYSVSSQ